MRVKETLYLQYSHHLLNIPISSTTMVSAKIVTLPTYSDVLQSVVDMLAVFAAVIHVLCFGKKITSPKAQPKSAIGFVNVTCAAHVYQYQKTSLLMLFCFISNIFDPRACCFLYEDMGNPISEAYNLTAISFSWAYISQTISVTRNSILDDSPGAQCLCTLLHHSMTQTEWSLPASGKPHSKKLHPNLITSLSSTRPSSILFLPSTRAK